MRKIFIRLQTIFIGAAFRILFLFSNLIISLFIIRSHGTVVWGEVVHYLLILDLAFAVINWGQAPYLVREFSLGPAAMREKFSQSFISRAYILFMAVSLLWLTPLSANIKTILTVWAITRYIYQSFYPVIQHERKFAPAFTIEVIGILIVILPLTFSPAGSTPRQILNLYAISFAFRAVVMLLQNRQMLTLTRTSLSLRAATGFLIPAFPFLLLTFSAMLHQRADLYIVAIFLSAEKVAQYQVFLNLLLFGQLGASLLLSPFSKNVFRLPPASFYKLERNFIRAGLVLSFGAIVFIYGVVTYLYQFEVSWSLYLLGYFYGLMLYLYLLRNYQLGKSYKQMRVALYSVAGFAANLALSFFLIPRYGLEGAMLAGTLTQLLIAVLYLTNPFLKQRHAQG